ncbi:PEP/pyruvate-binding domain-containing protein, partial [Streptomyces sp. DH37]|uniref:PEP/pyruvate-binding domain-containing protein n=1 Tax=Streptomyces sp. DH37 TaxID=3040122 RepID=UPI002442844D
GREGFAWDSYRRLIQMFGTTVLGIDGALFSEALARRPDPGLRRLLVEDFKRIVRERAGEEFPQDPGEQLRRSVRAVFSSWNGERARVYRRREHIPDDLGTAVNVQVMVFGNTGPDSGTGVAVTRDPATGLQGVYG